MDCISKNKQLILKFYDDIASSNNENITDILAQYTHQDWLWRGYHPFNQQIGANAVAQVFWQVFMQSVKHIQRRQDVFFAGDNQMDDFSSQWVVSMGHLMGLFDEEFLGIAPTHKIIMLRYCEFHKIIGDKIAETYFYCDIPHLMAQAGQPLFKTQTAQHLVQPGPMTNDGLLLANANTKTGKDTLALINQLLSDMAGWANPLPLEEELALAFAQDMIWWGPEGIGATYTIPRYAQQHAAPFRAAFYERSKVNHIARLAEGHYGGFVGYPNFTVKHKGGFMGYPASDKIGEFRVIDIYRRNQHNKLAENWVFIDLLHWLKTAGFDLPKNLR